MKAAAIIDACTLGELAHPRKRECFDWAQSLVTNGWAIAIPEIAEYESRRGLLVGSQPGLKRLDEIADHFGTLPTTREVLKLAAKFWAELRTLYGKASCDNNRLDADVIIAAQAKLVSIEKGVPVTIVTDNVRHFASLVDKSFIVAACPWRSISP